MRHFSVLAFVLAVGSCVWAEADPPPARHLVEAVGDDVEPTPAPEPVVDTGPRAEITLLSGGAVPEIVKPNTVLALTAAKALAGADAESVVWIVTPATVEETCYRVDNNRTLIFPVGPDECVVTVHQIAIRGDRGSRATVQIAVRRPGPAPGPTPTPVPVDETLSAALTRDVAARVTDANRAGFLAVSEAYALAAGMIDKGTLKEIATVASVTDLIVAGASKPIAEPWGLVKAGTLDPKLAALRTAGRLATLPDYAATWKEIAASIKAGCGAQPPPTPTPTPDTVPPPLNVTKLHVLMVAETENDAVDKLSPGEQAVLRSTVITQWLREHNAEFRVFDPQQEFAPDVAEVWKQAMAQPRQSLPWIILSNGRTGYSGPLPKSTDEAIALFQRFAQ